MDSLKFQEVIDCTHEEIQPPHVNLVWFALFIVISMGCSEMLVLYAIQSNYTIGPLVE